MNIKMWNELVNAIGAEKLSHFGIDKEARSWQKFQEVYLVRYGQKEIEALMAMIEAHNDLKGAKTCLADCKLWVAALNGTGVKPRSVSQFESLVRQRLIESAERNVKEGRPPGPRLYTRDEERGVWGRPVPVKEARP